MRESYAIALWSVLIGGAFASALWLGTDRPQLAPVRPLAPVITPAPSLPPVPAAETTPSPPPAPAETEVKADPTTRLPARPAPAAEVAPAIAPGPPSGDTVVARRYTDALNALSTEGYSGVDRIVPDGERFRATAIMQGQRYEVLVDPETAEVRRLSRPR